jgi:hypothetical protein
MVDGCAIGGPSGGGLVVGPVGGQRARTGSDADLDGHLDAGALGQSDLDAYLDGDANGQSGSDGHALAAVQAVRG